VGVHRTVGKFSGLIETMDESIKFRSGTEKQANWKTSSSRPGPCDSADIMYESYKYGNLPLNLPIGDRMYWLSNGAYTTATSSP